MGAHLQLVKALCSGLNCQKSPWTSLQTLGLSRNNLTGSIPPELGDLTNLSSLWIYDNKLTGPLPLSMTNLRYLKQLYIENNAGLCLPTGAEFQEWRAHTVRLFGLDHFEGRTFPGWHHHVVLTAITYNFLQAERRRHLAGLTFPAAHAIVQEIFTAYLFAQRRTT